MVQQKQKLQEKRKFYKCASFITWKWSRFLMLLRFKVYYFIVHWLLPKLSHWSLLSHFRHSTRKKKGGSLWYPCRRWVRNLPSCYCNFLPLAVYISSFSSNQDIGKLSSVVHKFSCHAALWTPAQRSQFWCEIQDASRQKELDLSQKVRQ